MYKIESITVVVCTVGKPYPRILCFTLRKRCNADSRVSINGIKKLIFYTSRRLTELYTYQNVISRNDEEGYN